MVDRDLALALKLQRQFDSESSINISHHTPPKTAIKKSLNLGCPEFELIDPTPNVYALFVQFDKQFFWNSLSSVEVRWSKRMYSCAGICRYQGKNGFCDIALSEPLLKLRSRKELIETLLHEMIHAYLFIVQKDRDRDGHGPNFQLHMHRINELANINITIYHTFIDEVNLYKTHWWRCDGPCQYNKPYFGIVRRTCNRAPGPSDFWWKRHSEMCRGKFIKIKEPEKVKRKREIQKENETKSKVKTSTKKPAIDLRQYFVPNQNNSTDDKINNSKDIYTPKKKIKFNDESTIPLNANKNPNKPATPSNSRNKIETSDNVNETVRNHWSTKYLPTANSSPKIKKNPQTNKPDADNEKKSKIDSNTNINITIDVELDNTTCTGTSVYNSPKSYNDIFQNIYGKDVSLTPKNFKKLKNSSTNNPNRRSECPLCNKSISNVDLQNHISNCLGDTNFNDDDFKEQPSESIDLTRFNHISNIKNCPICNNKISSFDLEEHLESCLNQSFCNESDNFPTKCESGNESVIYLSDSDDGTDGSRLINDNESFVPCPCCLVMIDENLMNSHLDTCLTK